MKAAILLVVAIVPVSHPGVSKSALQRLERRVAAEVQAQTGTKPVAGRASGEALERFLPQLLGEEIAAAWRDYYEFRWQSAAGRLAGRSDPDALALRALLAQAEQKTEEVTRLLARLARINRRYEFNNKEFPPSLIALFGELRKKEARRPAADCPRLGEIPIEPDSLSNWEGRLRRLARLAGWEKILVVGLEPLGWHLKAYGLLLSRDREPARRISVEMEETAGIPDAAKIVVRDANLVDTPGGEN